jgi:hypothetical protein
MAVGLGFTVTEMPRVRLASPRADARTAEFGDLLVITIDETMTVASVLSNTIRPSSSRARACSVGVACNRIPLEASICRLNARGHAAGVGGR